jgi:hypothetical protein
VGKARERCWRYDWVFDLDIKGFFDSIDWELMLKAVRLHTDSPWVLLYIERWLKASVQMENGCIVMRTAGTPQGEVISRFWRICSYTMRSTCGWRGSFRTSLSSVTRTMPSVTVAAPRRRGTAERAWRPPRDLQAVLHPVKTKVVYCKDVRRRGDFLVISFDFLGFQFRARKMMWRKGEMRIFTHRFQPAASPKALTRISREIRGWALHKRSDKSLTELAKMYNPCIRGWITYYSHFRKTQLRPTLERINAYVIKRARRKFKRLRDQTKGARDWLDRFRRANPKLFAHWSLCHGNGRTMGAV